MSSQLAYEVCNRSMKMMESSLNGFRPYLQYPNGAKYIGFWKQNLQQDFGIKILPNNLYYSGQWKGGKRHGWGTLGKRCGNGYAKRIYIGQWRNGFKEGEGKQFYKDGGVYFGYWSGNKRHGFGIMWFADGSLFLGNWMNDMYHGTGILFEVNKDRYEGSFENGLKNGEGKYFHNMSGQLQMGVWVDGICKCSVICDAFRNQAKQPTPYPIPVLYLDNFYQKVQEFFKVYMKEKEQPPNLFGFCERFQIDCRKKTFA